MPNSLDPIGYKLFAKVISRVNSELIIAHWIELPYGVTCYSSSGLNGVDPGNIHVLFSTEGTGFQKIIHTVCK